MVRETTISMALHRDVLEKVLRLLRLFFVLILGWLLGLLSQSPPGRRTQRLLLSQRPIARFAALRYRQGECRFRASMRGIESCCFGEALAFLREALLFCFSGIPKQRQKDGSEFEGPSRRIRPTH